MHTFYLTDHILKNLTRYAERPAFCFDNKVFTYADLHKRVSAIMQLIVEKVPKEENYIGVVAHYDIETYASLLAIMLSGKGYMPLEPHHPADRNLLVLKHSKVKFLLSSKQNDTTILVSSEVQQICTKDLLSTQEIICDASIEQPAYLLFTSGTTGIPKGVPISMHNLNSFLDSFFSFGFTITEYDRFLQMFDLTFDLSVMSYLVPLCIGACVYPVPNEGVKAMKVYEILEEHKITFALMVPSVINFLQPYFEDIDLPDLRYSQFCGEALLEEPTRGWQECCKNALIQNVYGPTENTIYCLFYDCSKNNIKSVNGIITIGKPMKYVSCIVVDENKNELAVNEKGELCLAGGLLTQGYWNDEERNRSAFFVKNDIKYYRTGDVAYRDEEDDFIYAGRLDQQIKIQGFRVELSEIEHHVRAIIQNENAYCIASQTNEGLTQIHLFIQASEIKEEQIRSQLKSKLPDYMIPAMMHAITLIPLNVNGKVDRKKLKELI